MPVKSDTPQGDGYDSSTITLQAPSLVPEAAVGIDRKPASAAKSWLRAIEITAQIEKQPNRLLADIVEDWAHRTPDAPALLSDRENLTYAALNARINRYARWALTHGVKTSDVVCLLMPSCPDYLAAWIGITRVGGVVALINTNLVGRALAHCINVAQPSHIIVADELADKLAAAGPDLNGHPTVWSHGGLEGGAHARPIAPVLDTLSGGPLSAGERREITIHNRALLIYTSGTTGLPKAAAVSHRRVLNWGGWFAGLTNAASDDRMYDCLPVYHSVGGCVATGCMLTVGGSVVLAEKFSATRFWDDIARWDCTMFQYIGELCRYLLKTDAPATAHRLRLACGNGLRGDVWEAFQTRFGIPQILEFYAATEGNFSLYNVEGKPGAIGRIPSFLAHRFPAAIVRFDPDTGLPMRDALGQCMRCEHGEPGEAIGKIGHADEAGGAFEGYTSTLETEKKILRDVFKKGDAWFRTGDLMKRDEKGFFYFVDRIGDTFRWKGENVAASEVAEAAAAFPGVAEASVYGVEVPNTEGRAGMVALVMDGDFDPAALHRFLAQRLPAYAMPLFVRLRPALEITETFKQKKQELMREGFDPSAIRDPLYINSGVAYVPLVPRTFDAIACGAVRV
jgi:fatty-acyl-CoA synthase